MVLGFINSLNFINSLKFCDFAFLKLSKFFKIFGEVCFLNSLNSLKFGVGWVGFGYSQGD